MLPKHRNPEKFNHHWQRNQNSVTSTWKHINFMDFQTIRHRFDLMELQRILVPKMCVICDLWYNWLIYCGYRVKANTNDRNSFIPEFARVTMFMELHDMFIGKGHSSELSTTGNKKKRSRRKSTSKEFGRKYHTQYTAQRSRSAWSYTTRAAPPYLEGCPTQGWCFQMVGW
jgi:hypothetical protein